MKTIVGNHKREVERIHRETKKRIRELQNQLLSDYFKQIEEPEKTLFNKIFPHGVPKAKVNQALDLLERTIEKKRNTW